MSKNRQDRYRRLIGLPVYSNTGLPLGYVSGVKIFKKSQTIKGLIIRTLTGEEREIEVNEDNFNIVSNKIILNLSSSQDHDKAISTITRDIEVIKSKIREYNDKLIKLNDLLIQGKINSEIFSQAKEKIEKERNKLVKLCIDTINQIDEMINDLDRKYQDYDKRRSELLIKKILESLNIEEEKELEMLDKIIDNVRKEKSKLSMLKMELQNDCLG
ncbi:MAG: hypothetical protein B6V02_00885 [Thermoprotei archaeon ex4572_64]|nr:MAG: hypothetical protein B6V02_00885 [Thermoprotei archaeon ex4572_64]